MKKENLNDLAKGNNLFNRKDFAGALDCYISAKNNNPDLAKIIDLNIDRAKRSLVKVDISKLEANKNSNEQNPVLEAKKQYEGRVEVKDNGFYRGWAVCKDNKSDLVQLEVYIDGVLFKRIKASDIRNDLLKVGKSNGAGGFKFQILPGIAEDDGSNIKIKYPNGLILYDGILESRFELKKIKLIENISFEKITVIVPVFNALEDLKTCIERLRSYTNPKVNILIINDASTDDGVMSYLNGIGKSKALKVIHNKYNLGFTQTVNKGIELSSDNDVVFLNSDARVTPRWLEGLIFASQSHPNIATVTPMSDRAGAFSAPNIGNDNPLPTGVYEEDYAVAFRRKSIGMYPIVPTGNGFCMFVRRKCINEIGNLDYLAFPRGYGEENDFCMRARAAGWINIIDDRTYVFHDRSKSFGSEKDKLIVEGRNVVDVRYPDYSKAIQVFSKNEQIQAARFKGKQALTDVLVGLKSRVLYVISTLTGGTPQTNRDLMHSLIDDVEPWLLRCDSRTLTLYKVGSEKDELICEHSLIESVDPLTHISFEYDSIVRSWLYKYDFEIVHIRHIAWHSLNLPRLAKEAGARVVKSFHDFYEVCPTVKLIDNNGNYCRGQCSPGSGTCVQPLWEADSLPPLKNLWVNKWRIQFENALSSCDAFVTTSESSRRTILENLKLPTEVPFEVIPHGRDFSRMRIPNASNIPNEVIKVLVPGNIDPAKGLDIIKKLLLIDLGSKLEFHIVGKCDYDFGDKRVVLHGEFKRDDFVKIVEGINPHISVVFSIWDETWCHTLTESWAAGLPAIVFNFPTVATRVSVSGAGWVVDSTEYSLLYSKIISIFTNVSELELKIRNVLKWQKSEAILLNIRFMAVKYFSLYKGDFSEGLDRLVAVCCPSSASLNIAPGSTNVRVWEKTINSLRRSNIYVRVNEEQLLVAMEHGFFKKAIIQRNFLSVDAFNKIKNHKRHNNFEYIYEIDDDLLNVPPDKDAKGEYSEYKNTLISIISNARAVMASTQKLANMLTSYNKNVKVFENKLKRSSWSSKINEVRSNSNFTIIYYGSNSHQEDLEMVMPALSLVRNKIPNLRLIVVGIDNVGGAGFEWIEYIKVPNSAKNYPSFVNFIKKLAVDCDMGIAPLVNNEFNLYKSPLKIFEYSALGLRSVVSLVGPYVAYKDLYKSVSVVPNSVEDWVRVIVEEYTMMVAGSSAKSETEKVFLDNIFLEKEYDEQVNLLF